MFVFHGISSLPFSKVEIVRSGVHTTKKQRGLRRCILTPVKWDPSTPNTLM